MTCWFEVVPDWIKLIILTGKIISIGCVKFLHNVPFSLSKIFFYVSILFYEICALDFNNCNLKVQKKTTFVNLFRGGFLEGLFNYKKCFSTFSTTFFTCNSNYHFMKRVFGRIWIILFVRIHLELCNVLTSISNKRLWNMTLIIS